MRVLGILIVLAMVPAFSSGSLQWSVVVPTAASIFVGSFLLTTLLLLVMPGRKGRLRTTRQVHVPGMTVEQVWQVLADRMRVEHFDIDHSGYPHHIAGRRPVRPQRHGDGTAMVTHASKSLGVEGELQAQGDGVDLQLTMWMNDFVVLDSGEGRHIDQMLQRLITADLERERPPVTPGMSTNAVVGLGGAVLTVAGVALPLYWPALRERWAMSYGFGLMLGGLYAGGITTQALRDIRSRPEEITGTGLSWVVLAVSVLGILGGVVWAWLPWIAMFRS